MAEKPIRAELRTPYGVGDKELRKFKRLVKQNPVGIGHMYYNPGPGTTQYGEGWENRKSKNKGGRKKGQRKRNRRYEKMKDKHRAREMAKQKRNGGHSQKEP